jgi:hypothetical protein
MIHIKPTFKSTVSLDPTLLAFPNLQLLTPFPDIVHFSSSLVS